MLSASGLFQDWSASFIAVFIVVTFFGLVFGMVTSWKFRRYKEREERNKQREELYRIRDNLRKMVERRLRREIEEGKKDSQDPKV